jgi:hypothetical protein
MLWKNKKRKAMPISVNGRLGGQTITTIVDSPIAKYYLENYLQNIFTNPEYDHKISRVIEQLENKLVTNEILEMLTKEFSNDFAALYFANRTYEIPKNKIIQDKFHSSIRFFEGLQPSEIPPLFDHLNDYLFAFVPGHKYKLDPTTGADFAYQRKLFTSIGLKNTLVETDELGTVEKNAHIVAEYILKWSKSNKIALVSVSKGGPEVAMALGKILSPEQLKNVPVWFNIGGALKGSFFADFALNWPYSWIAPFYRYPRKTLEDLGTKKRREHFEQLKFPKELLMLHYIGFPLSGQVSKEISFRYNSIKKKGPNDGLSLLPDTIFHEGFSITDVGLDHFYRDKNLAVKLYALLRVIFEMLDAKNSWVGHPQMI